MQRKRQLWAAVGFLAAPVGMAVGRLRLIGPNPGTYLALGVLAALSIVGIIHGFREAHRIARSDEAIGD